MNRSADHRDLVRARAARASTRCSARALAGAALALLTACPGSGPPADAGTDGAPGGDAAGVVQPRTGPRQDLRWKRARAVERDLTRALALREADLCNEFGVQRCLRAENAQNAQTWNDATIGPRNAWFDLVAPGGVHLVPLGGNDPYFHGQYRPVDRPIATTPAALDRVVLAACARRASRDADGTDSPPLVFTDLDLSAASVAPDAPAVAPTVTALYRRLLARDPSDAELGVLRDMLREGPLSGRQFATLACYTIATTTEFLFQ